MGRSEFRFVAEGRPAPQGSKSYRGSGPNGARFSEASKYLPAWRSAIVLAAKSEMLNTQDITPFDGPVRVEVTFFIDRPKTPKFPYPATTPDLDKLVRGLFDSITMAKVWTDDCLVVELLAAEVWTGADTYPVPGAKVFITAL